MNFNSVSGIHLYKYNHKNLQPELRKKLGLDTAQRFKPNHWEQRSYPSRMGKVSTTTAVRRLTNLRMAPIQLEKPTGSNDFYGQDENGSGYFTIDAYKTFVSTAFDVDELLVYDWRDKNGIIKVFESNQVKLSYRQKCVHDKFYSLNLDSPLFLWNGLLAFNRDGKNWVNKKYMKFECMYRVQAKCNAYYDSSFLGKLKLRWHPHNDSSAHPTKCYTFSPPGMPIVEEM